MEISKTIEIRFKIKAKFSIANSTTYSNFLGVKYCGYDIVFFQTLQMRCIFFFPYLAVRRATESETFEYLSPAIDTGEIRRASCPDTVIPGFAKRLAVKNFLGVVPMASLTQLAGPPIPVLPLGGGRGSGIEGSGATSGAALRGRYEAALERFAASYRTRRRHYRSGADGRDDHESASTRPILPGQKTMIRIRKNASLSLGISLIGGCETSLVSFNFSLLIAICYLSCPTLLFSVKFIHQQIHLNTARRKIIGLKSSISILMKNSRKGSYLD